MLFVKGCPERLVSSIHKTGLMTLGLFAATLWGQNQTIKISLDGPRTPISPYIYGCNEWCNPANLPLTATRWGGNRQTGYNWETNASNAGNDYIHNSDNFLVKDLSTADQKIPARPVENMQKTFGPRKQYILATVPVAGYVAADTKGVVAENEKAPSARWKKIVAEKPDGNLSLNPDLTDDVVYTDEFVNYVVQKVGKAGAGGINAWSLDNEPGLWRNTHARIHPDVLNVTELIEKSAAAAKAIKKVDAGAEVYGPATYGWGEMVNEDGGDWTTTFKKQYDWFISAYLAMMKAEGEKAGKRLLDVLDVHWYPEAQGECRIISTDCDAVSAAQIEARLQAPRSLWDSSYIEKSWIIDANGKTAINLFGRMKKSIAAQYPGTKMAVTEYEYGGHDHYSGGLAEADVLGIMGSEGVYMATMWSNPGTFSRSSFNMYLNYDGKGGKYGDMAIPSQASDRAALSTFAALDSQDPTKMHLMVVNKKAAVQQGQFTISGNGVFTDGKVFGFDESSGAAITARDAVTSISNNTFTYSLPAHSVLHFVLNGTVVGIAKPLAVKAKPSWFSRFSTLGNAWILGKEKRGAPVQKSAQ